MNSKDERALTLCEACGKPMEFGTYAVDDDGVSACHAVMQEEGECDNLADIQIEQSRKSAKL